MRAVALDLPLLRAVMQRRRAVDAREYEALTPAGSTGHEEALARMSRFGAVIVDDNGEPQAAIGVVPAGTPGAWLVWMVATDAWPRVWRAMVRWVSGVLRPALEGCEDVRRVAAFVEASNEVALRFAERLGLTLREGPLHSLGSDGSDWYLMARVR